MSIVLRSCYCPLESLQFQRLPKRSFRVTKGSWFNFTRVFPSVRLFFLIYDSALQEIKEARADLISKGFVFWWWISFSLFVICRLSSCFWKYELNGPITSYGSLDSPAFVMEQTSKYPGCTWNFDSKYKIGTTRILMSFDEKNSYFL